MSLEILKFKLDLHKRLIGGAILGLVFASSWFYYLAIAQPAYAVDAPLTMGYQGRLKDSSGTALEGTYDFTVRIYDALAGGNLEYTETHSNVTVTSGFFTIIIGSVDTAGNPLDLNFDETYFISTEVESDGEMTPRTKINSAAYALRAGGIETAAADPTASSTSALREGRIYFNTGDNTIYVYSGGAWIATGGGGGGAPTNATYLVTSANGSLSDEVVTSSLAANLTFAGNDAAARTITLGQTNAFDDLVVIDAGNWSVDSSGNAGFDGTVTASALSTNTTLNFLTNGEALLNSSDDTFTFDRDDAGTVTITASDDNATAALTVTPGGAAALTLGTNGTTTAITLATDGTGDAEVVLPTGSISGTEILDDTVALTTDTSGDYVQSITNGSGISGGNGGSEGAALTLALGALTANWNQTGAFDIVLNNSSSELVILDSDGTHSGTLEIGNLTGDATYTFSGDSGTVLTSANFDGTLDSAYLQVANDLSDIVNVSTARDNLGLGTLDSPIFTNLTLFGGAITGANSDYIRIGVVDATFAFARSNAGVVTLTSLDDDANADLTLSAGGTGALTIGDTGSATTITGTTITVTPSGAGNDVTINLVDNNADALDIQQGTNNYLNIATSNGTETMAFGNTTTNPAFNFLGSGTATFSGVIAANGDSITADGATLTINAGGTVDVTDTLNADSLTTDVGGVSVPAATGLDTSGAGALLLAGTNATSISICNSAACDTVTIGTNTDADAITIGDANDTVIIDSANWSIDTNGDLIVNSCTGCGGGGATLQTAYDAGATIETAGNIPVLITETDSSTTGDLLQLTNATDTSEAGGTTGDALQITLDGADADDNTGHGIHIIIDQSQSTGNAILLEDDGGNDLFIVDETGALTVNGDSITADGATLTINAGGTVDVQDALTADSLSIDTTINFLTNGDSLNNATDDIFDFTREDAGIVTITASDDDATAALTILPGGAAALVLGGASTTAITLTTDSTGDAEVVLPADSVSPTEINDNGTTLDAGEDEMCLTYEDTGGVFAWQNCAGGAADLQSAYDTGNEIETAGNLPVIITETDGAATTGDLLQLTLNTATGGTSSGDALQITLDADDPDGNTGNGIHIIIDQSQSTGNAILIEDDGGNDLFIVDETGALTVNGDSITADGATLTINAGGTVNVTDILNADSLTTDTGGLTLNNSESITNGTDGTLTLGRNDAGIVTVTAADDDATAALTILPGGAAAFVLGGGSTTAITLTTDSTGDAEVVLPDGAISSTEILDNTIVTGDLNATLTFADDDLINLAAINSSDGAEGLILPQNATACSAAVAEGQICWDTAGEDLYVGNGSTAVQMNTGGAITLQAAYTGGNAIEVDGTTPTPIIFRETTSATNTGDILQITNTAAGANSGDLLDINVTSATGGTFSGDLLMLTMDAVDVGSFSGNGLHLVIDTSQTSVTAQPILIEEEDGTDIFVIAETGGITVAAVGAVTTAITVNDTDFTNALSIGDNNIVGSTALIDFTDFDVNADGKISLNPDDAGDAILVDYNGVNADMQGAVFDFTGNNNTTQTAGIIDIDSETNTTNSTMGVDVSFTIEDSNADLTVYGNQTTITIASDAGQSHTGYGEFINVINNDATSTAYGLAIIADDAGGQAVTAGLLIQNQQSTDIDLTDGILIQATTADSIVDGLDVSDGELTNSINVGSNPIVGVDIILSPTDQIIANLTDNIADALDIQQGSDNYININTTNSSEALTFGNTTTNPTFAFNTNNAAAANFVFTAGGDMDVALIDQGVFTFNVSNTSTTSDGFVLRYLGSSDTTDIFKVLDEATDTSPFTIEANGQVGIGTDDPAARLHFIGDSVSGTGTTDAEDFLVGTGGTGQACTAGAATCGTGGALTITGGTGGAHTGTNDTQTAGIGGALSLFGGNGGAASGAGTTLNLGGVGGYISLFSGTGGDASNNAGQDRGGAGGDLFLSSGFGGSGEAGGAGGTLWISGGDGGVGSVGGGAGGNVFIYGGAPGGGGSPSQGNVLLGLDQGFNNARNVVIGTQTDGAIGTVDGRLTIYQTSGADDEILFMDSEETTTTQAVFTIETDATSGSQSTDDTKVQFFADGRLSLSLEGTAASVEGVCASGGDGGFDSGDAVERDAILTDCSGTPAVDYMEIYPVAEGVEIGDVLVVGEVDVSTNDGETIKQLVKSTTAYDYKVIGVASNPDMAGDFNSIGHGTTNEEDNPWPVALNGRVPVKIATDSFDIEPGDLLTTSTQPGRAMKATQPGQIIGKALEAWSSSNPTDTIMMFVSTSFADSNSSSGRYKTNIMGLTFGLEDLKKLRPVLFDWKNTGEQDLGFIAEDVAAVNPLLAFYKDNQVEGVRYKLLSVLLTQAVQEQQVQIENIYSQLGLSLGQVAADTTASNVSIVDSFTAQKITVLNQVELGRDTVGRAIILAGATKVKVTFENEYAYQPVVTASLRGTTALTASVVYSIVNETTTGFEIQIANGLSTPIEFNWHAFAAKQGKIFISDGTVQDIAINIEEASESPAVNITIDDGTTEEPPIVEEEDQTPSTDTPPVVEEEPPVIAEEEEPFVEAPPAEEEVPPSEPGEGEGEEGE